MKIGILTFHSQLNYGGVLQCWALQTVLSQMGHEVVVLDRWLDAYNTPLWECYSRYSLKIWALDLFKGLLGAGNMGRLVRRLKTNFFIRSRLNLTSCHFVYWSDASELFWGLDAIVVGSDQVFNVLGNVSAVYLLTDVPHRIKKVSYAASFGMKSMPKEFTEIYRKGLAGFDALSFRETSGVDIANGLGSQGVHVADPTLLLDKNEWLKLVGAESVDSSGLVCYFLGENINEALPLLRAFSKREKCNVDVFVDRYNRRLRGRIPFLDAFRDAFSTVKIHLAGSPLDFVAAMASAKFVVSDSFHALMFATIFSKNIRLIKPHTEFRMNMQDRIIEFVNHHIVNREEIFVPDVQEALTSFCNGRGTSYNSQSIKMFADKSRQWLSNAIGM